MRRRLQFFDLGYAAVVCIAFFYFSRTTKRLKVILVQIGLPASFLTRNKIASNQFELRLAIVEWTVLFHHACGHSWPILAESSSLVDDWVNLTHEHLTMVMVLLRVCSFRLIYYMICLTDNIQVFLWHLLKCRLRLLSGWLWLGPYKTIHIIPPLFSTNIL